MELIFMIYSYFLLFSINFVLIYNTDQVPYCYPYLVFIVLLQSRTAKVSHERHPRRPKTTVHTVPFLPALVLSQMYTFTCTTAVLIYYISFVSSLGQFNSTEILQTSGFFIHYTKSVQIQMFQNKSHTRHKRIFSQSTQLQVQENVHYLVVFQPLVLHSLPQVVYQMAQVHFLFFWIWHIEWHNIVKDAFVLNTLSSITDII